LKTIAEGRIAASIFLKKIKFPHSLNVIKSQPKRFKLIAEITIVVILLAFFTFGNSRNIKYVEAQASMGSVSTLASGTGTFQNISDVYVPVFSQNPIDSIFVKVGDSVKAGQVLARLVSVKEHLNLVNAKNLIRTAQIQYANAEKTFATTGNVREATLAQLNTNLNAALKLQEDDIPILQNAVTVATLNYNNEVNNAAVRLSNYENTASVSLNDLNTAQFQFGSYANLIGEEESVTAILTSKSPSALAEGCALFGLTGPACTSVDLTADYVTYMNSWQKYKNANLNYQNEIRNKQLDIAADQQQIQALKNALDLANLNLAIAVDRDSQAVQQARDAIALYNAQSQLTPEILAPIRINIANAKEGLASAEWAYANTIIKAPVSGTISAISASINSVVAPAVDPAGGSKAGLFRISGVTSSTFKASFAVDQGAKIQFGNIVTIESTGFTAPAAANAGLAALAAAPNKTYAGTVLSSVLVPGFYGVAAHYEVEIAVTKPDSNIFPGVNGKVSLPVGLKKNVLVIPKTFIYKKSGQNYVLVKVRGSKNKEAAIKLGAQGTNTVEVLSGLKLGDIILKIQK
jgi:multidrug efflux pump subunit AcrA (membrane-fusion protein)